MSAILVLLALLSVATLASRRGTLRTFVDTAATPLLIAAGALCTPAALGVLSAKLIGELQPALAVGVTWVAVMTGLRAGAEGGKPSRATSRATTVVITATVTSVVLAAVCLSVPRALGLPAVLEPPVWLGAALVMGGAMVGSPPVEANESVFRARLVQLSELVATLGAVAAITVLPAWSVLSPIGVAAVVVGSGLGLGLLQRLTGGSASGDSNSRTIAMLGLVTLAAGLLHNAALPSAVTGLVAGLTLSRTTLGQALREELTPTELPARIVVAFLVGTLVSFEASLVLVGALVALSQLAVQLVSTSWAVGHSPSLKAVAAGLTSSATPLIVSASFMLAGLPGGSALSTIAASAVFTADSLAVVLTLLARSRAVASLSTREPLA